MDELGGFIATEAAFSMDDGSWISVPVTFVCRVTGGMVEWRGWERAWTVDFWAAGALELDLTAAGLMLRSWLMRAC